MICGPRGVIFARVALHVTSMRLTGYIIIGCASIRFYADFCVPVFWSGVTCVILVKMLHSSLMAAIFLSPMLDNGAYGAGFYNACASSCATIVAFSVDDLYGILPLCGRI